MSSKTSFTELLIQRAVHKFCAPRKEVMVSTGSHNIVVHKPGEKLLHLPNGTVVKVTVDDSGVATQVEEPEHLHAIVRPKTYTHQIGGLR